jgi:hypothetical protein
MGCGASSASNVAPDGRGATGPAYVYPADECLHRDRFTEQPIDDGSMEAHVLLEFSQCCRSVVGRDAAEPGPFGRATRQLSIVMRARLLNDINGDADQFEPQPELESELEACAGRVREWFEENAQLLAACEDGPLISDLESLKDDQLASNESARDPNRSLRSQKSIASITGFTRHFSKNSATDYIQFSPNASRRSTVHETESPDDHRFASSFPDAESFDEDPHRLPLISTRSGPLDADAPLGSPVLTTGATPKRRETSVPLRLEVLKLHDKIIAEKRSFNGPKSPPL